MSIIYLVNRLEMSDEINGLQVFPEKAFISDVAAKEYCEELDANGVGFEYTCPCGCGDTHYRSWSVEPLVLEE